MMELPEELEMALRFHGHVGPWLVLGMRIGKEALERLKARKYFGVRVEVSGPTQPPPACLIDGLQVATGATTGKGNLVTGSAESFHVTLTNRDTGESLEVVPLEGIAEAMRQWLEQEGDVAAGLRLWEMPADQLYVIRAIKG